MNKKISGVKEYKFFETIGCFFVFVFWEVNFGKLEPTLRIALENFQIFIQFLIDI